MKRRTAVRAKPSWFDTLAMKAAGTSQVRFALNLP